MGITIVEIIPMNLLLFAHHEHVHQTVSDALIIVVFRLRGIVTVMMIVVTKLMSQKIIVRAKSALVSAIFSLVTTATAFHEFIFVTAIMIV